MTPEERQQIKLIQQELRQPLAPSAHKIRALPGTTDLYIYLPWQSVRDRLEEVVPDYCLDFDNPVYDHTVNLVSIKATIEILGIKKSAIAGVKISIISQKGNNAEIGHCIDRLHAEAIKNAGEAWCVGRYLDDQIGVYKMLWESQSELDPDMRGKLSQMKSQFAKKLQNYVTPQKSDASPHKPATSKNSVVPHAKAPTKKPESKPSALYPQHQALINQVRNLTGHSVEQVHQWCQGQGYSSPGDLPSEIVRQLADDLVLGWAESKFASPAQAEKAYNGKITTLTASGMSLGNAIASWMDSVTKVPVG